jgi:hypothetical protein
MIVHILASVAGTIAAPLAGGLAYRKVGQRRVAKPLMIGIPNGIVEERFVGIDPPRSFEPLGNKMIAGVHVDLPHPPGAGVDELVRHSGRHHHDLPAAHLNRLLTGREGGVAFLHHKDLLVWVPVQPRTAPRRVYDEDRDAGAQEATLKLAGLFPARRVAMSGTRVTPHPLPTAPPPAGVYRETAGQSPAATRRGPGPRYPAG